MIIVTIVGARPQFVKAAVVSRTIRQHYSHVKEYIIHTGQHYDTNMSNIFFEELDIPEPAFNLGIGGGSHGSNTGLMLIEIEKILLRLQPNVVLVYGDTDSTLAGALAASKLYIPVVHVEAGLRSFNKKMPEELNRILTDHVASLLLTPTITGDRNLQSEGFSSEKVINVGDVMFDATIYYCKRLKDELNFLASLNIARQQYHLVTIHREENTSNRGRLSDIFEALSESELKLLMPLHPRTAKMLAEYKIEPSANIKILEPVGYLEMMILEKNAKYILTDSGGVQKEAFFLNIPCFTIRDETEWTELIDIGSNVLVKPHEISGYLNSKVKDKVTWENASLYGDGNAGRKIVNAILERFD